MTRSCYARLLVAGVKIYEYEKGFIHAKTYLSDDETAMVGTIKMDYRSLVHHFENGVWIYNHRVIGDIKKISLIRRRSRYVLNAVCLKKI